MRPARRRGPVRIAALALLLGGGACRYPATSVEVGLASDVPPERLAGIAVRFDHAGHRAVMDWTGDTALALPASFVVRPAAGVAAGEPAELSIEARIAPLATVGAPVTIRRVVRFQFVPRQALRLPVFLTLRCAAPATGCTAQADPGACTVSALCEERGQTCAGDGACVSIAVTPEPAASEPSSHWVSSIAQPDAAPADAAGPDGDAGTDAGTDADADAAGPCVLVDDFESPTAPSYWSLFNASPPLDVFARTNGRLEIGPTPNAAGVRYAGYYSNRAVDVRDGRVAVEVVQSTAPAAGHAETLFELQDGAMVVRTGVAQSRLVFQIWDVPHHTPVDETSVTYDPVAHRFWRFRGEAGATVVWETSADGASWVERRRAPSPLDLSRTYVVVNAGTWDVEPAPGVAQFDNVRIEGVCR